MSMKRAGTRIGTAMGALLAVGIIQCVQAQESMPGMKMPNSADATAKSSLPGFAAIGLSEEIQQRIGVTIGRA